MDGDLCVGKRGGALGGGYVVAEADRSWILWWIPMLLLLQLLALAGVI